MPINTVIKPWAVAWIVAYAAFVFLHTLKVVARVRMGFRRPVAGFALDVFETGTRILQGSIPRGVTGQASGVGSLIFFDQCPVSPGMAGVLPVFIFPRVAGQTALFPHEDEELGNGDRGREIGLYLAEEGVHCGRLEGTLQLVLVLGDPGLNFRHLLIIRLDGDYAVLG